MHRDKQIEHWRASSSHSPFASNLHDQWEQAMNLRNETLAFDKYLNSRVAKLDSMIGEPKYHVCNKEKIKSIENPKEKISLEFRRLQLSSTETKKEFSELNSMINNEIAIMLDRFPRLLSASSPTKPKTPSTSVSRATTADRPNKRIHTHESISMQTSISSNGSASLPKIDTAAMFAQLDPLFSSDSMLDTKSFEESI